MYLEKNNLFFRIIFIVKLISIIVILINHKLYIYVLST